VGTQYRVCFRVRTWGENNWCRRFELQWPDFVFVGLFLAPPTQFFSPHVVDLWGSRGLGTPGGVTLNLLVFHARFPQNSQQQTPVFYVFGLPFIVFS